MVTDNKWNGNGMEMEWNQNEKGNRNGNVM